jgi:hypothetical protein
VTIYACGQCGASLAFDGVRTAKCPYCDSPNFVERPPAAGQPDPQFALTFVGDAGVARNALQRWLGSRNVFADSRLKRAKVEDIRGIYAPAYLYSAVAQSDFTATIGENYTETETYTETDSEGKSQTRTRTVTRTEHVPLAGRHISYVTDVIVSASAGLSNAELQRVEPYDLKQMRRFAPELVSGWIAEEFARPVDECRKASHGEAMEQVGTKLHGFMPGDSYRDLTWSTKVSWEAMDPILVPVWVFAVRYREDKDPLRVVINGQTGKITGKVPLSAWRIMLLIAVLLGIAAAIFFLVRSR